MHHNHRGALALVDVVVIQVVDLGPVRGEGILLFKPFCVSAYQSISIIAQLIPLPMPKSATRSPAGTVFFSRY